MKNLFLVLLCVATVSRLAAADTPKKPAYDHYYVSNYPKIWKSCDQAADAIAENFTRLTGVKVALRECLSETSDGYNFRFSYTSATALNQISTTPIGLNGTVSGLTGTYASRAECQSALKAETQRFQAATGLEPVVAYCFHEGYIGSNYSHVLKIDAFGKAKLRPFHFEDSINDLGKSEASILATMKTNLTKAGLDVRRLFVRRDSLSFYRLNVVYYSAAEIGLTLTNPFTYTSQPICLSRLGEVRDAYTASGITPLSLYCSGSGAVVSFGIENFYFRIVRLEKPYQTLADCDADKAAVSKDYAKDHAIDVKGAVCSGTSSFRVKLFTVAKPTDGSAK